jgi:hypothetical protein
VLGGLGYSLAWLVLPIEQAGLVAMVVLGGGVALVAARVAWFAVNRTHRPSSDEG